MKIYEILEAQLKKQNDFVTDDGELKKWVVISKAQNADEDLIALLMDDAELKSRFFSEIKGALVFRQSDFVRFMEQKNFLNDSFTAYRNKVGLAVDGKFMSQRNEVSLVWPFKDCVLEGGQNREEEKREEIFFNEILAQDEITQLLEPKVLTNAKSFDCNGQHEFKAFNRDTEINKQRGLPDSTITDNLIIKGNNLLTLYTLEKEFSGRVKLVYIDPPYNTGGGANTFKYNNTFNHSTWLTFMRNRLEVSKRLLSDNGAICIAIDDEEYAHLKLVCDDVFGRENYVGTIVVQSNPRGRTINSHFATCHEYALFYAKSIDNIEVRNQPLTDQQAAGFDKADTDGEYRLLPFRRSGGTSTPDERPNSEFTLYYSPADKNIVAVGGQRKGDAAEIYEPSEILALNAEGKIEKHEASAFSAKHDGKLIEILPIDVLGKRRVWRWSDREAILNAARNGDFHVVVSGGKYTVQLKDRIKEGRKPKTIWFESKYDASANGTMLLKGLFEGEKVFSYPKSIYTLEDTIKIMTDPEAGDIVLDFFGGSGTTAHAVLKVNKSDDGNRQFIIAEQLDYVETVTTPRVLKSLQEIKTGSFTYFELKKYNQGFIDQIQDAADSKALLKVWQAMKAKSFLNYNVDLKKQEEHLDEFKALDLADQKAHLISLLDKNQLYVNLSSMNDKGFDCSAAEKQVTRDFYQIDK